MSIDAAYNQLGQPDVTAQELADIAAAHAELRPHIAAHPLAYPELLSWLADLADPAVDAALVARFGSGPPRPDLPSELPGPPTWAKPGTPVQAPTSFEAAQRDPVRRTWLRSMWWWLAAPVTAFVLPALFGEKIYRNELDVRSFVAVVLLFILAVVVTGIWVGSAKTAPRSIATASALALALIQWFGTFDLYTIPRVIRLPDLLLDWAWRGEHWRMYFGLSFGFTLLAIWLVPLMIVWLLSLVAGYRHAPAGQRTSTPTPRSVPVVVPSFTPQGEPQIAYVLQMPGTNVCAILSLVFGLLGGVVGIVLGHVSLSQIKRTGESGRGMAIAGLILGYFWLAGSLAFVIWMVVFASAVSHSGY